MAAERREPFDDIANFGSLMAAFDRAILGKRKKPGAAAFCAKPRQGNAHDPRCRLAGRTAATRLVYGQGCVPINEVMARHTTVQATDCQTDKH